MPKSLHLSIFLSLSLILLSVSAFSQKTITGVVSDTLNQPLESANLIAKPLQEKAGIKFENRKKKIHLKYIKVRHVSKNVSKVKPLILCVNILLIN